LSSWWWAEKLPETCRALTIIKNIAKRCIFLVVLKRIEILMGWKPKQSEKNLSHCHCLPQIPHGLAQDWTWASRGTGWWPTVRTTYRQAHHHMLPIQLVRGIHGWNQPTIQSPKQHWQLVGKQT
jgi:hypothetical protein